MASSKLTVLHVKLGSFFLKQMILQLFTQNFISPFTDQLSSPSVILPIQPLFITLNKTVSLKEPISSANFTSVFNCFSKFDKTMFVKNRMDEGPNPDFIELMGK